MLPTQTHLSRLSEWIANLSHGDIPDASLQAARYQIMDILAALHAAARSRETACLADGLAGFAGDGRATVFATGRLFPPDQAALANAAWSMAQDYDDIIWMGHTGHSCVFAALAVAQQVGSSAQDTLTAIVAANEVAGRLGAASFLGPLNGQMWTFIHLIGAATAAARLLGLDAERTTHALAIALAQPNFALQPGFLAPTSKLLAAATPTATGVQAAYFARAGMTGAADILENRRGFFSRFTFLPLTSMLGGLGEFWAIQTLTVKTFPGCHYFQTACSAIGQLLLRRPVASSADVRAVRIATTLLGAEVTRFGQENQVPGQPVTTIGAAFDLAVSAGIMLHAGRLTPSEVEPAWLAEHAAAIDKWRRLISVTHAPELTLQTIASARAVAAGRSSLGSISAREVLRLVGRYRAEYGSKLISPGEVYAWLRALAGWERAESTASLGAEKSATDASAIPLPFPNRVEIEYADGSRRAARVDLPVGSVCADSMPAALEEKFMQATSPALGADGARVAWAAGLAFEDVSEFLAGCVAKV